MAEFVQKDASTGNKQKVDKVGRAWELAISESLQKYICEKEEGAYQVIGDFASINNSTHTLLHIKNTDKDRNMVITFIRSQALDLTGGTTLPSASTYFSLGFGRTVSSGGTSVSAVNLNAGSGKTPSATFTDNNPTMTGTFTEFDRKYVKDEGEETIYRKEGSIILGLNQTLEVRITSDHTAGLAQVRVSFFMEEPV